MTVVGCSDGLQSGSTLSSFGGVTAGQSISPTAVKLTWAKNSAIKEYRIYNNLTSAPIATTALDYFTIENLQPDTSYVFKVIGTDGTTSFGSDKEIAVKT
ncbi:fibronectin type III domain-containing protein, partial [bacterium]